MSRVRFRRGRTGVSLLLLGLAGAGPAAAQPRPGLDQRRTPIVAVVERTGGSVVNISAEHLVRARANPFLDFAFDPRRERRYTTESLGSGVVIDAAAGVVVTNNHVISGASRIIVTTSDGRELEAEVKGADADNDLAVLTVDAKGLKAVKVGTTEDLMIGETVIAIGNPFGLSNTVTSGIVSAVHRTVQGEAGRTYSDFIQTDAAINPGNSGGALVNVVGELIGINTAIVGGANTIGFAIPVDRVKRIADDLLHFGTVKPVWLGLRGKTITSDSARASARGLGFRLRSVFPGSPAEQAGLAPGDLIVSINGKPVETREDFDTAVTSLGPDSTLQVVYKRKDAERTTKLKTARAPEDLGLDVVRREIGLALNESRSGVLVASVVRGSAGAEQGLARGDRILAVNNQKVQTLDDLNHAIEMGFSRSSIVLVVARGPYAYTLTFGME
jgi:serine protease Do